MTLSQQTTLDFIQVASAKLISPEWEQIQSFGSIVQLCMHNYYIATPSDVNAVKRRTVSFVSFVWKDGKKTEVSSKFKCLICLYRREEKRKGYIQSCQWWFEWFPSWWIWSRLQQWSSVCRSGLWRWVAAWCPVRHKTSSSHHQWHLQHNMLPVCDWLLRLISESSDILGHYVFLFIGSKLASASVASLLYLPS